MGSIVSKLESLFKAFEDNPVRVLMLGLDGAGKTTILYQLKLEKVVKTIPTIGFNVETITPCKGLNCTVWDVGGQTKLRRLWKHYYKDAGEVNFSRKKQNFYFETARQMVLDFRGYRNTELDGLIFVVDSADPTRFKEAKEELFGILADENMTTVPVLILANKQDMAISESVSKIIDQLELISIPENQRWNIQPCSGIKGDGIVEGLQSFSRMVKEARKRRK